MQMEKHPSAYRFISRMAYPIMILVAFVITGFFISGIAKVDVLNAYVLIFIGAFGSVHAISEVIAKASPIILTGVAAAFALKCGFVNVGVEGQMIMGALATTGIGLSVSGSPFMVIPLAIFFSFLIGATWGVVAAFIRTRFRVSEIIITIMMNFIALYLAQALIIGPWAGKSPEASGIVMTDIFGPSIYLPRLIPGERAHIGILIAIVSALFLYFIIRKTSFGFGLTAVGSSPKAARFAGLNISRSVILTLMISGGIAGFAGMGEVAGLYRFMRPDFSLGYGFIGLTIAYVANANIPLTTLGSFLFGALMVGAGSMRYAVLIPPPIVPMFLGIVLVCIIVAAVMRTKTRV